MESASADIPMTFLSLIKDLAPIIIGSLSALGGAALAHWFDMKRWRMEQPEAYKTELYTKKMAVYNELLSECLGTIIQMVAVGASKDDRKFLEKKIAFWLIVQKNALLISEPVRSITGNMFPDKGDSIKTAHDQYRELANMCRKELGIEALSADVENMFQQLMKAVQKLPH